MKGTVQMIRKLNKRLVKKLLKICSVICLRRNR